MKKCVLGIVIGIAMAMIWSVCFINILDSMAGVGIGICFCVAFGMLFTLMFSSGNKKDK